MFSKRLEKYSLQADLGMELVLANCCVYSFFFPPLHLCLLLNFYNSKIYRDLFVKVILAVWLCFQYLFILSILISKLLYNRNMALSIVKTKKPMFKARLNDNTFDGQSAIYSFFKKWKDVFLVARELHTSLNCAHKNRTTKHKDGSKRYCADKYPL